MLDHCLASGNRVAGLHDIALMHDGARAEVARAVGEGLVELDRETVCEIVEHIFARRDVDIDIGPLLGRDIGQAAFHQRLAGRDDLHDRTRACGEVSLHAGDDARRLHRGDQMVEEALLGAFERRARGRFGLAVERALDSGDVRGPECSVEIVVDDLERPCIGVIDALLLSRQRVLEQFIFDAVERQ